MTRLRTKNVNNDFKDVIEILKQKSILPQTPAQDILDIARSVHESTYSLIIWKFRMSCQEQHRRVYLEEIASDALQLLPMILMGYSKPCKLLMRGVVENALRHVYFHDHPIEFIRQNTHGKWYIPVDGLFEYIKHHPSFLKTETQFDAISQLSSLYSDLSAGVHGRTIDDLQMCAALTKLTIDQKKAEADAAQLKKCTQAVNFLLAILHHARVSTLSPEDRSVILRSMPIRARASWKDFE